MTLYLRKTLCLIAIAAAALVSSSAASAQQWNDRTVLTFSEPMIVPGATLQPGTYVFQLVNSDSNRHVVKITKEDSGEVVTLTQAVPTKRAEAKGDIVLRVSPTDPGTPPAVTAWFYPGSRYGHQFVYPDEQAREIAQRTKTLVLSGDVAGSDASRATLYTYDATGNRSIWSGDSAVNREWQQWRDKEVGATAMVRSPGSGESPQSAPMVQATQTAMKVKIDELEDSGQKYIGKTISVDGEVEDVLGPRIFSIDEPNWADLEGELLVTMPSHLVALIKDDDRVTVTGTLKPFVRAEFEREWGWFDLSPEVEAELAMKPVLVADRIVGGNNDVALVIETAPAPTGTAGTAGRPAAETTRGEPIDRLGDLADARRSAVGRRVHLDRVDVVGRSTDGKGFWIRADDGTRLFVLPAQAEGSAAAEGAVSIEGIVLQMPSRMRETLDPSGEWNDDIYVLATSISAR